jgi:hypothetical protein
MTELYWSADESTICGSWFKQYLYDISNTKKVGFFCYNILKYPQKSEQIETTPMKLSKNSGKLFGWYMYNVLRIWEGRGTV